MSVFDDAFQSFNVAPGNSGVTSFPAPTDGTGDVGSAPNFPVFSSSGNLLGNLTSSQGQPSVALPNTPSVPNVGGVTSSPIAQAAASAGITGGANPPAATTGSAATGSAPAWFQSYFARGTIVILGFVFVGVGIAQFGRSQR